MLAALLDGPAKHTPDRPAIVLGDRPVHTWATLAEAVARRAAGLAGRLGVAPGDHVAIVAANCPEYLEILFSIWHAGAVAVPISAKLHPREVGQLLAGARAKACFAGAEIAEGIDRCAPEGTRVLAVAEADDRALAAAEPAAAQVRRAITDDAWIFFTSGTTGRSKGARLTHGNLLAMTAAYYADVDALGGRDTIIHIAALTHASGLFALSFLGRGATQVLPASGRFDAAELVSLIAAGQRSTFFLPPTLLGRLCRSEQLRSAPVQRIGRVLVGAAPTRARDLRTAVAALGPCVWNGYGQGESPCTITAMSAPAIAAAAEAGDDALLSSVGRARFATRVRVLDGEGLELPPGEVGEVAVDGPTVMAGYLDMPRQSAETIRDGWLHTGDLGVFDERGHLTLVDRVKDVVITGGYNVYPSEVEEILRGDPNVAEVSVIGVPDEEWGERLVAYLVAGPAGEPDPAALERRCLEAIARHKRPREYHLLGELPRNAAGKVLKGQLRELHVKRLEAARAPR